MKLFLPDVGLMFWMLIGFLIVLLILAKVGWPMIMGAVSKRNQHISDSLTAAQEANDALAGIQAAKEKALAESQAEQIRLMNEMAEMKKQLLEEARNEARDKAEQMITDARQRIEKEQAEAMAQIRAEVITLSVDIAEKVLQRELNDKEAQNRYIEEILKNNQQIKA
ncbi:MAG: F0F1 ATP synthase subunit B [Bacteroidales bacterium]|nr:F0F1 ATP synthase subunit B [Bacteroidales bacterium]